MKSSIVKSLIVAAAFTATMMGSGLAVAQDTYPERPVTWLIPMSAGGGTDTYARTAGSMMNQEGLTNATFLYENRPGGNGVRGLTDLVNQKKGDDYTLFVLNEHHVTVPWLSGDSEFSYKDITLISRLAIDYYFLVVREDSPYKTLNEFIESSKEKDILIGVGLASIYGAKSLVKVSDASARLVPFEGAQALTALLGGHIDSAMMNPAEVVGHLQAGGLRALAVTSPERLDLYPDVPTVKESGYDLTYSLSRAVAMPPGVSPQVAEFWTKKFHDLSETASWKADYIVKNSLESEYLDGPQFREHIEKNVIPILKEAIK